MKLEDMPTPEHDALFGNCNDRSLGDELCMIYALALSLEKRLGLAVSALKGAALISCEPMVKNHVAETLVQIEKGTK